MTDEAQRRRPSPASDGAGQPEVKGEHADADDTDPNSLTSADDRRTRARADDPDRAPDRAAHSARAQHGGRQHRRHAVLDLLRAHLQLLVGAVLPGAARGTRRRPTTLLTRSNCGLLVTDPLEGFGLRTTIALYGGIALAMPVILWQVWRFIAPGLYKHERRYAVPFVVLGSLLFPLGGALAYWTMPKALDFLISIGGPDLITVYSAKPYLSLITKMILAFGLAFEFPLLLAFLQMIGIVTPQGWRSSRRYAAVGITVLVAVITPSGDPITLVVLAGPMYLFYELSIIFGQIWVRRRERKPAVATAA